MRRPPPPFLSLCTLSFVLTPGRHCRSWTPPSHPRGWPLRTRSQRRRRATRRVSAASCLRFRLRICPVSPSHTVPPVPRALALRTPGSNQTKPVGSTGLRPWLRIAPLHACSAAATCRCSSLVRARPLVVPGSGPRAVASVLVADKGSCPDVLALCYRGGVPSHSEPDAGRPGAVRQTASEPPQL